MSKRAHVVLPDDIAEELSKIAGSREKSAFIAEAVKEKLARIRLLSALERTAGAWKGHPEFATSKAVHRWVRKGRTETEKRLRRLSKAK